MPEDSGSSPAQGAHSDDRVPPPPPLTLHSEALKFAVHTKPTSEYAEGESKDGVNGKVGALENRIRRAEIWMICLTAIIALFTIGLVVVGIFQWRAMSGQLDEMKASGSTAASQIWEAIGNMNWLARISQDSLDASKRQNANALRASVNALRADQRAWVGLKGQIYTCLIRQLAVGYRGGDVAPP